MSLLPWCVAVPFACGALLLAASRFVGRQLTTIISVSVAVATAGLCGAVVRSACAQGTLVYWFGGWHPGNGIGLGIAFGVEPLGASVALGVAVVTIATLFYAHRLFDDVGVIFDVLVLVHLAAAIAFVYTADLFDMLVFYELTSVIEFALAGFQVTKRIAVRGAFNFAIATGLGAFSIIFGLTLLEGKTGQLNAVAIGESLIRVPTPVLAACAFGLIASGLLIKAAVPPFHFWFVDAQTAAPTPVGVLFSGVVSVLGIYALEKTWTMTFASAPGTDATIVHGILATVGLIGALGAALLSFTAADLKRAIAFAAAANTALFAAAGIAADERSLTATVCLAMGFIFSIAALAMWIGILEGRLGTVLDDEYAGRGRALTGSMVLGIAAIIAIAGMPPVPTALGRALLPAPFAAGSVLTAGLIAARFTVAAWQAYGVSPSRDAEIPRREPSQWFLIGPAMFLAAAAFGVAAIPWSGIAVGVSAFAGPHTIANALLHHSRPLPKPSVVEPSLANVLLLAGATILVAAGAATARPVVRRLAAVRRLHDIHNGSVGDYVTWLASGVAAVTGILVMLR